MCGAGIGVINSGNSCTSKKVLRQLYFLKLPSFKEIKIFQFISKINLEKKHFSVTPICKQILNLQINCGYLASALKVISDAKLVVTYQKIPSVLL